MKMGCGGRDGGFPVADIGGFWVGIGGNWAEIGEKRVKRKVGRVRVGAFWVKTPPMVVLPFSYTSPWVLL